MLWSRDVSNILEYKPSLKSTGGPAENNVYSWKEVLPTKELECGGPPCARKLKLTQCQYAVWYGVPFVSKTQKLRSKPNIVDIY